MIEIAESSVTDVSAMGKIKSSLAELGFGFAYDDFGAGQARLLELTDIPPDYLKLDMGLIQGLRRPSRGKILSRRCFAWSARLGSR